MINTFIANTHCFVVAHNNIEDTEFVNWAQVMSCLVYYHTLSNSTLTN